MTERLYYQDSELLEFSAEIVSRHDGDGRMVILDRTAFYPTSGGQPHDVGTLNGVAVTDVTDEGEHVIHHLAAPLAPGPVRGQVEPLRRRDHTQQHTAQHLLSALAADRFGWRTVSVHFGPEHSTIEVEAKAVDEAAIASLEAMANQIVAEARPVTISFEMADEAIARGLRTAPTRTGEVRVVTIAQLDRSACGGTHLTSTSAAGLVRLLGIERMRSNTRISFVAGDRTVRLLQSLQGIVAESAAALACAPHEIAPLLARRLEELLLLRKRVAGLEEERVQGQLAREIAATIPGVDGVRRCLRREHDGVELMRLKGQGAAPLERVIYAGVHATDSGSTVLIAASQDSGADANALLRRVLAVHGGKGGGSPRLAQGSAPVGVEMLLGTLQTVVPAELQGNPAPGNIS